MRYFLLILLILGLVYLNLSYAYFFNYIGNHFLAAPAKDLTTPNLQKPKFIALGDSLLAGVGSSSEKQSLGYLLYEEANKKGEITFINLAAPGAKLIDVLSGQLPIVLKEQPETVVILIGINDVHDFTKLEEFEKNYRLLANELSSKTSAKIVLINIPYLGSSLTLLPPWNFYMDLKTRQYNSVIEKIAREKNLKLVDLYSLKDRFQKTSDLYSKDQFHPSDEGYRIWAQFINSN